MIDKICCFTGHRPEKLHWSDTEIVKALKKEILNAIDDGYSVFISGMAKGVDIWAAEIVLRLKAKGRPIHLVCALPYDGFGDWWAEEWRQRYLSVLKNADSIATVCTGYHKGCFQARNKWMVDHSSRVIAVFNGEKGGTRNTVEYALKHGKDIKNTMSSESIEVLL